ncbi:MAG TPA: Ig-like domain-containing protein, partial [Bryobacteraceae bacterium]|nr:Ig-like domain-containing protein [Bryobacteraceae bacterium]
MRFNRRVVPLMAVALGSPALLSAQPAGGLSPRALTPLACTAAPAIPRSIRYEGMAELIGDMVLSCTGGTAQLTGTVIPTVDITLSLNTNVTSRLLGATGASEALLLLDEPGSQPTPVPGFGPQAPQILCSSPIGAVAGGCVEYARDVPVNGVTVQVPANSPAGTLNPGANVFQGVVSANQVAFHGVPILPPAAGYARVIRITNVRANAAGLTGGGPGVPSVTASLTANGPVTVNVTNPVQTVGSVQPGLITHVRDAGNLAALPSGGAGFSQCTGSSSPVPVAMLQFGETFGTAFVTRVAPTSAYSGQSAAPVQNLPGAIYNSESGFVFPAASNGGAIAGLADYGTRLKATFNNIPAGVRVFVSVTNLASDTSSSNTPAPSGASTSPYAALIQSESSADGNGIAPTTLPTTSVNGSATGLAELTVVNGSATAVWEVIDTNPAAPETFQFGVWQQFTANGPPQGTVTVNLGFAPTFATSVGSVASSTLPVARFADTSSPVNLLSIGACQTSCTYTLSGNATYPAGASTNSSVTVAASASTCAWTASSPVNWVTITTGSTGTGNGTVQFNILANANSGPRGATLTIAGQSYAISQAGQTKATSTTALLASPASATAGQTVTVTATVSPSSATGTVTFSDGTGSIGILTLNNGIASLSTSILAAGSHSLTAAYS